MSSLFRLKLNIFTGFQRFANYTGKAHPNEDIAKGRIKIHRGKAIIGKSLNLQTNFLDECLNIVYCISRRINININSISLLFTLNVIINITNNIKLWDNLTINK